MIHNKQLESYVVQDPPAPPSDTLLLPTLTSLYSDIAHNRELSGGEITTGLATDTTFPIPIDYKDMDVLV